MQGFPTPIRFGQKVTVFSWNIKGPYDDPQEKMRRVAKAINDSGINPDIVMLQEIAHLDDAFTLAEMLNGQFPRNRVNHWKDRYSSSQGKMGLATLVRNTLTSSLKERNHLNGDGERQFSHDFGKVTCGTLSQNGSPFEFDVYNTHLVTDKARRRDEADCAGEILAESFEEDPNRKALVMGDLNDTADSVTLDPFKEAGMHDVVDPACTVSSAGSNRRIDHCLVSSSLKVHVTEPARVLGKGFNKRNKNPWKKISDHLPVVMTFDTEHFVGPETVLKFAGTRLDRVA